MKRQSDMYHDAIRRFREDNGKSTKRPAKCSARKRCYPIVFSNAGNATLCCGLNWIKKDMDVLRLCFMRDDDQPLRLRFTSVEGRDITSLIIDGLATFDRYFDPEYDEMMENMEIKRLQGIP